MTARPMSEEERSLSDEEWAAMTDEQWLQHRIDRCAAWGWTVNKERYERILAALLSTSASERGLREALEECAAPWDSGETSVPDLIPRLSAEFQRRMNIAGEALAALSHTSTKDTTR